MNKIKKLAKAKTRPRKETKTKSFDPQWSRQFLLQENPPADRWIPSWILDPYEQDRKVITLNIDIPLNIDKLVNKEEE